MIGADRFIRKLDDSNQSRHAEQRYERGFSDIDMWNFDVFLADVIVAGCDWYMEHNKSTPWNLEPEEWNRILGEIRDGFSSRGESGAPNPSREVWLLLHQHFRNFWD